MIKNIKARLRAGIKSLYLRHVWPQELDGSPWSLEAQTKAVRLDHMQMLRGAFNMEVSMGAGGPMGEWIAGLIATLMRANEGVLPENYRECQINLETFADLEPGKPRERVALTVQRCKGLTPHEARQKAENERNQAHARANKVQAEYDDFRHKLALAFDPEGDTDSEDYTLLHAASMVNELRERAEAAAGMVDQLNKEKERLNADWLKTVQANAELGTATVEALCEIGELRSIIWHFALRANLAVADAMKTLNEPQQQKVQTIWREARDAQKATEKHVNGEAKKV